jgi:catechol 2,3-dioxygenase-like lactoylglutathione lyase family enzyme
MALRGLELHHQAVRMRPDAVDESLTFFRDVLGLEPDPGSPSIEDIPLFWMNLGNDTQLHMFAVDGVSRYARQPDRDPFWFHTALGVPDVEEAEKELERLGVEYWRIGRSEARQLFMRDPSGNMIELHQIGTCRCTSGARQATEEGDQ